MNNKIKDDIIKTIFFFLAICLVFLFGYTTTDNLSALAMLLAFGIGTLVFMIKVVINK